MDDKPSISVIIPAFNEEGILENSVLTVYKTFESLGLDFEICIVNDKSTDKTGEIAEKIASGRANIKCIHHEKNQGLGGAFQTGIANSRKEFLMLIPVDNPLGREEVGVYLKRIGVCDIVVGFRLERVGYNTFSKFASFAYNRIMIPLLFNIGLSDVNWIQVYRRSIFTEGIIKFRATRIFFLVEILIRARRNRLIIAEVPAIMKQRAYGYPTIFRFSIMWETFCDMLRFFFEIRKEDTSSQKAERPEKKV